MSAKKEKDILNNIKKAVEAETPDVWDKIQAAEKYKYNFNEKPLKTKARNRYMPVMIAAALCGVIALAGTRMKSFEFIAQGNESVAIGSEQDSVREILPARAPEDSKGSSSTLFDPFTKDADVKEASKAFGINVVEPNWMPQGFTKTSAKLYSNDKGGKQPYMYNIEYKKGNKPFAITIMKYMAEEEKLKAEPAPMPELAGGAGNATSSGAASGAADIGSLPPDAPVQSKPGYDVIEPVLPNNASDLPAKASDGKGVNAGGVSSGSTGSAPGSEPVSVQLTSIKIRNIEVSMTVVDSKEEGALSAAWIYEGGSYSIYTDGITKEDMIKIVESMIK
jgi:hypothetical protein